MQTVSVQTRLSLKGTMCSILVVRWKSDGLQMNYRGNSCWALEATLQEKHKSLIARMALFEKQDQLGGCQIHMSPTYSPQDMLTVQNWVELLRLLMILSLCTLIFLLVQLNLVKLGNCPIIHKFSSRRSAIMVYSSNLHGYEAVRIKKRSDPHFQARQVCTL